MKSGVCYDEGGQTDQRNTRKIPLHISTIGFPFYHGIQLSPGRPAGPAAPVRPGGPGAPVAPGTPMPVCFFY